jgi:hypothetical protein
MNTFCVPFFSEFELQYEFIKKSNTEIIAIAKSVILLIEEKIKELFRWLRKHKFNSIEEEIHFFKELKPIFISKLIYYKTILKLETNLPNAKKNKIKYYEKALNKINDYSKSNRNFYEYYRERASYNDSEYFVRIKNKNKQYDDCYVINYDSKLCTSHDYIIAVFVSNDMLTNYLERKIEDINNMCNVMHPAIQNTLNWSGSKIDLVELIYALHHSKLINNGNSDIKELASYFSKMFNIELEENIYRWYIDIKRRKSVRTKFLNQLTENLNNKLMEEEI